MKRFLLSLIFLASFWVAPAHAQFPCSGNFPAGSVCGTLTGGTVHPTLITSIPSGQLTVGATQVTSGFNLGVLFSGTGILQQVNPSANCVYLTDSTNTPQCSNTLINTFTITTSNNTVGLTINGINLTGSNASNGLDISGTWNTSGSPTAIKLNIINTASGTSARLLDLQNSGNTRFSVDTSGNVVSQGTITASSFVGIPSVAGTITVSNVIVTNSGIVSTYNLTVATSAAIITNGVGVVFDPSHNFGLGGGVGVRDPANANYGTLEVTSVQFGAPSASSRSGFMADNGGGMQLAFGTMANPATANVTVATPGSGTLQIGASATDASGGLNITSLIVSGTVQLPPSTTGGSVQTFTNSPCTTLTSEQWIAVSITGRAGTWRVPACQ